MLPRRRFVIDFHVTGICNLNCPFCCGTPKRVFGPSFESIKSTIDKLKKVGVTTMVLTGGEPLMRKDLLQIIRYIRQKGLEIYLSTNGILLLKYWSRINRYLDCIGLPLDGSTMTMSKKMGRDKKSYQEVIRILKFFKKNKPSCLVKIGTVVSQINKNDLIKIGQLVFEDNNLYHPDTWRLYQFSPLSFGARHQKKYKIMDREFNGLCQKVREVFPGQNIAPLSNVDSNDSYFFIDPELKIILLTKNKFVEIGDMQTVDLKLLRQLKNKYSQVVYKGSSNRKWLSK